MNLSNSQILSIIINISIFLLITIGSIIFIQKIKLDNKGYKYLFIVYTFFWIPIMLLRPYRATMQKAIDVEFVWIVTAIYGFIGIFARIFADVINYIFKYKKVFLYICIIGEIALIIPLMIHISTINNILSSLSIGLGASCIGTYELLFKEQYQNNNKKAFLTISILSIPPLLANFITSPIQSIVKTASTINGVVDPHNLILMWYIAMFFLLVTLVMLIIYKEKHRVVYNLLNKKYEHLYSIKVKPNNNVLFFISLSIIGSIIAFVKFSNSGAMGTLHLQNLASYTNSDSSPYEGYLSVIFSLAQLVAGVLMGTVLIRKMNTIKIFLIGAFSWIIYCVGVSFIRNPIGFTTIHLLNGFGYGILYNLILAMVLYIVIDNKVITKVGIYQSILAIGITLSGWFTGWLKTTMDDYSNFDLYMKNYFIQNLILIGATVLITFMFIISNKLTYKNNQSNDILKSIKTIKV